MGVASVTRCALLVHGHGVGGTAKSALLADLRAWATPAQAQHGHGQRHPAPAKPGHALGFAFASHVTKSGDAVRPFDGLVLVPRHLLKCR